MNQTSDFVQVHEKVSANLSQHVVAGYLHYVINIEDQMNCPQCKKSNSIPIVYGKPTRETIEKAKRNEVKLGGCMLVDDSPNRYCQNCQQSWIDKTDPNWIEAQSIINKIRKNRIKKEKNL
jgi:hypothetical protein